MPVRTLHPTVEVDVNLDRLPANHIPPMQLVRVMGVDMLALYLDGVTLWLRRDQANELASRLMVHLDSATEEFAL